MNGKAFPEAAGEDERRSDPEALPIARLPGFLDVAAAPRGDTRRPEVVQKAWRIAAASVPRVAPSAPSVSADPGDLVARALAILAEETEAWRVRRGANPAPRSSR
jgi:hypothetical protein